MEALHTSSLLVRLWDAGGEEALLCHEVGWKIEGPSSSPCYELEFDHTHGVRDLLQRLAASPLVRQTLPNAAATCQQYFGFKRDFNEPMNNFLVREALGYAEFVEALLLLYED